MDINEKQAFILGSLLTLSNRLQLLGDRLDPKMTMKQWLLIAVILKSGHAAPALSEVAGWVGSSRQNVKKMALLLESRGFLELRKDERDARVLRLSLTGACASYFAARSGQEQFFMDALFRQFTPDSTEELFQGMNRLTENIGRMEQESETKKAVWEERSGEI